MSRKFKPAEQINTLYKAFDFVTDWNIAIDAGACTGTWSVVMAARFKQVHAFEPVEATYYKMFDNNKHIKNINFYNKAILHEKCQVNIKGHPKQPTSIRSKFVTIAIDGNIEAISIDSLRLKNIGLIKLDLEGAELLALKGASKTIKKYSPVLIIEIDKHTRRFNTNEDEIRQWLNKHNYVCKYEQRPDAIYVRQ